MAPVRNHARVGFTLVELLVVIGIIALLVGILVPTVARVRQAAFATDSSAVVRAVSDAIQAYYNDFQAYPGPLPDNGLAIGGDDLAAGTASTSFDLPGASVLNGRTDIGITGTENLVLGLLGGLRLDGTTVVYDPARVGSGPVSLGNLPGSRDAYLNLDNDRIGFRANEAGLTTGDFKDSSADARDSIIPEIVDSFPSPLPMLYLRAGATAYSNDPDERLRRIAGYSGAETFNLNHIAAYVTPVAPNTYIGEGREELSPVHAANGQFHGLQVGEDALPENGSNSMAADAPYDAIPYLLDPTAGVDGTTPRGRDSYVLISAGRDRVYGTKDDITSFGSVVP